MVLDIHTGEYSLFFEAQKQSNKYNSSKRFLNKVKKHFCRHCRVTTLEDANDTSTGHLYAYASNKYNVEYSFLYEIYGGYIDKGSVDMKGFCFKMFNPNTVQTRDFYI